MKRKIGSGEKRRIKGSYKIPFSARTPNFEAPTWGPASCANKWLRSTSALGLQLQSVNSAWKNPGGVGERDGIG